MRSNSTGVGNKRPAATCGTLYDIRGKDGMATNATSETFETEVLKTGGKVIVDFWAEWCGPCHAVSPVLDRIADERDLKVVKVNIDHEQGLAQRYGVSS